MLEGNQYILSEWQRDVIAMTAAYCAAFVTMLYVLLGLARWLILAPVAEWVESWRWRRERQRAKETFANRLSRIEQIGEGAADVP